jgi:hypothetical protein
VSLFEQFKVFFFEDLGRADGLEVGVGKLERELF